MDHVFVALIIIMLTEQCI